MADDWDLEETTATGGAVAEAPMISVDMPEIKLFGRWSCDEVTVSDMSLADYISVKEKNAKYLPHSAGRYAAKRFRKAQCPIIERLTNSLMMHGRNSGKKLMAVKIVRHTMEIIYLLTGENPLQVIELGREYRTNSHNWSLNFNFFNSIRNCFSWVEILDGF